MQDCLLALQWKDIDWDTKTITFGKGFWTGRLMDSTKNGQEHVRHMTASLERILAKCLEESKIFDRKISFSVDPMMIPGPAIRRPDKGSALSGSRPLQDQTDNESRWL